MKTGAATVENTMEGPNGTALQPSDSTCVCVCMCVYKHTQNTNLKEYMQPYVLQHYLQ